jgi:hypothetical protein
LRFIFICDSAWSLTLISGDIDPALMGGLCFDCTDGDPLITDPFPGRVAAFCLFFMLETTDCPPLEALLTDDC